MMRYDSKAGSEMVQKVVQKVVQRWFRSGSEMVQKWFSF
jgi:hypothetical protein